MIYEVRARLFYDHEDTADHVIDLLQVAMQRAIIVHPDEPNQQGSSIELIKCYHDETPTKPCVSCGEIKCP